MTDWELRSTDHGHAFVAEVLEARPLTPTTHHLRVSRHPDFAYEPVQFTYLCLHTPDEDEPFEDYRPMSLASTPTRDHLEYGVRVSQSAFKQAFTALERGDDVLVEGPRGDFVLDTERPAILVAGGIGITPLKGMAEYAADEQLDIPVRLLYSNRSQEEIAYRAQLEALADEHPPFEIVHTLTREPDDSGWTGRRGRIDEALLDETIDRLPEASGPPVFYLCGTPGMVEGLAGTLAGMGIPGERVRYEQFWGYE